MLAILRVIAGHLVLVDGHAEPGLVDAAPARAIGDRDALGEDVVSSEPTQYAL